MRVCFLILTFIFWLFLPFLCISPYIGDNVSFKCRGGDFKLCFNLFSFKKKKKEFCFLFLWFSTI